MTQPDSFTPPPARRLDLLVPRLIGPAFVLLAVWFLIGPSPVVIPHTPHTDPVTVSRNQVTTDPLRQLPTGPPTINAGGYQLGCMECHRLFDSPPDATRTMTEHLDIVLDHGLNDRCFNCHDNTERDKLRLHGGAKGSFTETPRLCLRCHGPTFRDWQRGIHGRTSGSWDGSDPRHRRLICTECHDPHAPAFAPMVPLPGPHTLRQGDRVMDKRAAPHGKRNPLLHWVHKPKEPVPADRRGPDAP